MTTGKEARRGIGPAWVAVALGALVALALVVTSRSEGRPIRPALELGTIDETPAPSGGVLFGVHVTNMSAYDVEVLDVSVPDVDVRFGTGTGRRTLPIAALDGGRILLRVDARCPDPPSFDRIKVRLRIDGREAVQTLRLGGQLQPECR